MDIYDEFMVDNIRPGWHMSGMFDITAIILLQTDLYLCNTHLTSMH